MRRFAACSLGIILLALGGCSARQGAHAAAAGGEGGEPKSSCVACHLEMDPADGPVAQWRKSVHAANGIGCHNCHGGDPAFDGMEAMSPARGFVGIPAEEAIPSFCGRCHAGVAEDYLASAHGEALGAGGPQCVTCHGNHHILPASIDLINRESCTRCHDYARAEKIRGALAGTEEIITRLDREIAGLRRIGMETEALSGALFAVRNDYRRLFHSVDEPKVVQQTASFQARLGEVRQGVDRSLETVGGRRKTGALVVGLFSLTTIVCSLWRRTYALEEKKSGEPED